MEGRKCARTEQKFPRRYPPPPRERAPFQEAALLAARVCRLCRRGDLGRETRKSRICEKKDGGALARGRTRTSERGPRIFLVLFAAEPPPQPPQRWVSGVWFLRGHAILIAAVAASARPPCPLLCRAQGTLSGIFACFFAIICQ